MIFSKSDETDLNEIRWTIKEAAYKAYFPIRKLVWKDVVLSKQEGKPTLDFWRNGVKEDAGVTEVRAWASISHDGEFVIGQVILEKV